MHFSWRMGVSTIWKILYKMCDLLWDELRPEFLQMPDRNRWKQIADDFEKMWNYPNYLGSVDGKHCNIIAPSKSGSVWFCYKKHFPMVLMAVADAFSRFTWVNVGVKGSAPDSLVFQCMTFGQQVLHNTLDVPPPRPIHPYIQYSFPYVFVADEAFPGRENLLKPYPGSRTEDLSKKRRVFNYRLSRARRTVEGAFGLLAAQFRFLKRVVEVQPENYRKMIMAAVVLHNYIMQDVRDIALEERKLDEVFTKERDQGQVAVLQPLRWQGLRASQKAKDVRSHFAHFFNTVGQFLGQRKAAGILESSDSDSEWSVLYCTVLTCMHWCGLSESECAGRDTSWSDSWLFSSVCYPDHRSSILLSAGVHIMLIDAGCFPTSSQCQSLYRHKRSTPEHIQILCTHTCKGGRCWMFVDKKKIHVDLPVCSVLNSLFSCLVMSANLCFLNAVFFQSSHSMSYREGNTCT